MLTSAAAVATAAAAAAAATSTDDNDDVRSYWHVCHTIRVSSLREHFVSLYLCIAECRHEAHCARR